MSNIEKQAEEVEVLLSIYGDDCKVDHESSDKFSFVLSEGGRQVTLYFHLPEDYPAMSPPSIEMSAPLLSREQKDCINEALNQVYLENVGETVIYQWIEKVREILQSLPDELEEKTPSETDTSYITHEIAPVPAPEIIHGDVIEDRKSFFQAHVAKIATPSEADAVLWNLKCERKIASATHNITAWRCGVKHDCDDDGEKSAGSRLLRLLELANADNIIVVVSRWYGGIHLGSVRFRHINDAARQALVQAKIIQR